MYCSIETIIFLCLINFMFWNFLAQNKYRLMNIDHFKKSVSCYIVNAISTISELTHTVDAYETF